LFVQNIRSEYQYRLQALLAGIDYKDKLQGANHAEANMAAKGAQTPKNPRLPRANEHTGRAECAQASSPEGSSSIDCTIERAQIGVEHLARETTVSSSEKSTIPRNTTAWTVL
jgi:hypothetical protein